MKSARSVGAVGSTMALLSAVLALLLLAGGPCVSAGHATPRGRAYLERGVVETMRLQRHDHARMLITDTNTLQLFLIGLAESAQGDELRQLVKDLGGGAMVHSYIPEDHFLVMATLAQVEAMQDQMGVTAAPMPPSHKVALDMDYVLSAASDLVAIQAGAELEDGLDDEDESDTSPTVTVRGAVEDWTPSGTASSAWTEMSAIAGTFDLTNLDGIGKKGKKAFKKAQKELKKKLQKKKKKSLRQAVRDMKAAVHTDGSDSDGTLSASMLVLLVSADKTLTQELVTAWQQDLLALHNSISSTCTAPTVTSHAPKLVLVTGCPADLAAITAMLSKQAQVAWIQPQKDPYVTNMYASALMQSGTAKKKSSSYDPSAMQNHPYWNVGLDGTGQAVAVVDTGANMGSCYFNDPNVDFLAESQRNEEGKLVFKSNTHRKVLQYYGHSGMYDESGHGSHVSGTVLGSPFVPGRNMSAMDVNDATGMAPGAKLVMFDVGSAAAALDGGGLDVPTSRGSFMYDVNYLAGARIQCNSWGESVPAYTFTTMFQDQFLWEHPDFLNVQAAGNDGAVAINPLAVPISNGGPILNGTVSAPAFGKNSLAVGGAESYTNPSLPTSLTHLDIEIYTPAQGNSPTRLAASFLGLPVPEWPVSGKVSDIVGKRFLLELANPADACAELSNADLSDKAVLFVRGTCTFASKANRIAAAAKKPSLGIMINNEYGELPASRMQIDNPGTKTVPMVTLRLDVANTMLSYFQLGYTPYATISSYTDLSATSPFEHIASYSSFGPTKDGRQKPDLVAPGAVLSAYTNYRFIGNNTLQNDQCATRTILQGTSMATPVVAGAAALVRQYFAEGFGAAGFRGSSFKVAPSGVLVKAILIAGTAEMKGYSFATNQKLAPAPSAYQGFGRLDLSRSLPLLGDQLGWQLQVVDMVAIVSRQTLRYKVQVTGQGPLIVVLSWYDYPSFPGASGRLLINDLDLTLTNPDSTSTWGGNQGPKPITQQLVQRDNVNNIEKIILEAPKAGAYTIRVNGNILNGKSDTHPLQYLAIAVLGGLDRGGRLQYV